MSRLLFLYEFETPTSSSMREFYKELSRKGHIEDVLFVETKKISTQLVDSADVIFFVRATDPLSVILARECQRLGKFVVAFYDDDLLNVPDGRPVISWRKNNVKLVLKESNVVLSCSGRICGKYKQYTKEKRGITVDTAVRESEYRSSKKTESQHVRIVYAANADHVSLFDKYIKPTLAAIGKVEGKVEFTFVGVHPAISVEELPSNIKVRYVNVMPFLRYRKYMDTHDFDLGLAPLENDEFSKCKYINKFIEYAIFQIPCIFSNVEPYTSIVKHGENGYLVDNTTKDWERTLCDVLKNQDKRERCGVNAISLVRNNFNEHYIVEKLFDDMPEIETFKSPGIDSCSFFAGKITYSLARLMEVIYLTRAYFCSLGIKGLTDKVIRHIREKRNFQKA